MTTHVCPLGYCTFEEICPHAPCIDCMRRLGEHMVEEMKIIGRQADHASSHGDFTAAAMLDTQMEHIGDTLSRAENFRAADVEARQLVSA